MDEVKKLLVSYVCDEKKHDLLFFKCLLHLGNIKKEI